MSVKLMKQSLVAGLLGLTAGGAIAANLVVNGDFESGNASFTSQYSFAPASNTLEGQYTVRNNPAPWNPFFISAPDHTPGAGTQMFVGNGGPTAGQVVWQSTPITVAANTGYFFESWVMNVCCSAGYPGGNSPSILDFSVRLANGTTVSLGTVTTTLALAGNWEFLSTTWNSGANAGAVTLQLINRNTNPAGNDFAIDDITFDTVSQRVPEPGIMMLFGVMLAGFAVARRRRA